MSRGLKGNGFIYIEVILLWSLCGIGRFGKEYAGFRVMGLIELDIDDVTGLEYCDGIRDVYYISAWKISILCIAFV